MPLQTASGSRRWRVHPAEDLPDSAVLQCCPPVPGRDEAIEPLAVGVALVHLVAPLHDQARGLQELQRFCHQVLQDEEGVWNRLSGMFSGPSAPSPARWKSGDMAPR